MRQIHVPDRAALQLGIPCSIERKGCLEFLLECQRRLTQPGDDWSEDDLVKLESFDLLFWNPFSAALMWAYRNIYLSLEGGLATMTFGSEATAVLHIYNALKQRELVDDDLPLLSDIDEFFSELKWFWNGWEKPEPGKFVYRYHLCMGAPNELATWEQDMQRHRLEGAEKPGPRPKVTMSKLRHTRNKSNRSVCTRGRARTRHSTVHI